MVQKVLLKKVSFSCKTIGPLQHVSMYMYTYPSPLSLDSDLTYLRTFSMGTTAHPISCSLPFTCTCVPFTSSSALAF